VAGRYWLETLGCPKNQVDSDKLAGLLESEGYKRAGRPEKADLLVVNTCAFIEAAREESIGAVLELAASRKDGAKLVVTGCMAERYGQELADALPEVDQVAGFGVPLTATPSALAPSALAPSALAPSVGMAVTSVPVSLSVARHGRPSPSPRPAGPNASRTAGRRARRGADSRPVPSFDLLNLPRPRTGAPWAYVKVAEGCDRHCGFCAIPSFRGPQRSRSSSDILDEVDALGAQEVVLVAQDLVSWGRDRDAVAGDGLGQRSETGEGLVGLVRHVRERVERVRLLYLYPSGLNDELIDAVGDSGCPYFDLSLQHVSRPLVKRMRRFGDGARFLGRISDIRGRFPDAALRSSFIVGYPGETEEDHDALLAFLAEAELDWVGFFAFSSEDGTYAAGLEGQVPSTLVVERIRECSEVQDAITAKRRNDLVGTRCRALVDTPGHARSHREAPEIDGVVRVPTHLPAGTWVDLQITEAFGPDLIGEPVTA
jgi:ribosomal protein S12 methylthiotransferase